MDNEHIQELREGITALELSEEERIKADLALNRNKQADPFRQAGADLAARDEEMLRIMMGRAS